MWSIQRMEGSIMKKRFTAIFILAVSIVFMSQIAVTADETWKIGGDWDYTLRLDGEYNGYQGTATEAGVVSVNTTTSGDKEILQSYSLDCERGNLTIPSLDYSYDYSYRSSGTLLAQEYIPGETLEFPTYDITVDDITARTTIRVRQTGAYSASGTVTIYFVNTGETFRGNINASKPQPAPVPPSGDGGGGGCNAGVSLLLLLAIIPVLFKRKH